MAAASADPSRTDKCGIQAVLCGTDQRLAGRPDGIYHDLVASPDSDDHRCYVAWTSTHDECGLPHPASVILCAAEGGRRLGTA